MDGIGNRNETAVVSGEQSLVTPVSLFHDPLMYYGSGTGTGVPVNENMNYDSGSDDTLNYFPALRASVPMETGKLIVENSHNDPLPLSNEVVDKKEEEIVDLVGEVGVVTGIVDLASEVGVVTGGDPLPLSNEVVNKEEIVDLASEVGVVTGGDPLPLSNEVVNKEEIVDLASEVGVVTGGDPLPLSNEVVDKEEIVDLAGEVGVVTGGVAEQRISTDEDLTVESEGSTTPDSSVIFESSNKPSSSGGSSESSLNDQIASVNAKHMEYRSTASSASPQNWPDVVLTPSTSSSSSSSSSSSADKATEKEDTPWKGGLKLYQKLLWCTRCVKFLAQKFALMFVYPPSFLPPSLPPSFPPSHPSLPLSLHTHTHTHTQEMPPHREVSSSLVRLIARGRRKLPLVPSRDPLRALSWLRNPTDKTEMTVSPVLKIAPVMMLSS